MKKIIIPAVLLGGYLLYKSFFKIKDQIRYEFKSISLDKRNTSLTKLALNITLSIINPTETPVRLKSLIADVSYKENLLGRISKLDEIQIQPKAITNIELPISIPTLSAGLAVATLVKSGSGPELNIKGAINLNTGTITIDATKKLDV